MPTTKTYAIAASAVVAVGLAAGGYAALFAGGDKFAECGSGVATGAASIGGPFELVDHTGRTVSDADVIDRPTLVYFGYTFCPDVCPVDASNMAIAQDMLAEKGVDAKTAFISIDPARDTPEVLADFVENLNPNMVGLTGDDAAVAKAAKAYRVYYQKAEGDDPEYYLMDHSAFVYLMAPEAGFLSIFRHGAQPAEIAETSACYINALG